MENHSYLIAYKANNYCHQITLNNYGKMFENKGSWTVLCILRPDFRAACRLGYPDRIYKSHSMGKLYVFLRK